ncbi:conserved protein, unknown function [Hepatocystis sp. ex Piliocolobus tephrosceles]|nr:conserved protein, unknown function [Hepatocystis sp. ex Piliocolobus tephrosceles]
MILFQHILKLLLVVYILLVINIQVCKSDDDVCANGDKMLEAFWQKLNTIEHGEAVFILLKNYYCPACVRYMDVWHKLENKYKEVENKIHLFTFDCACHLFVPFCRLFQVKYYPTFRLLYPVYEMEEYNTRYITHNSMIDDRQYVGNLLLCWKEVDKTSNLIDFVSLIKSILCDNIYFNDTYLQSCSIKLDDKTEIKRLDILWSKDKIKKDDEHIDYVPELPTTKWEDITISKHLIKHDIILGLIFTLKHGISLNADVKHDNIEAYVVMLKIVSKIYKDIKQDLKTIIHILNKLNYPVKYNNWIQIVDSIINTNKIDNKLLIDYLHKDKSVKAFNLQYCPKTSILCTFWLLYHKISIYCLIEDKDNYNYYVEVITDYTKNYLNCKTCINHFLEAQKMCYYGFCNIHSAESVIIYLWRIHNAVNLRTTYDTITSSGQIKSGLFSRKHPMLNKDIAFPSKRQCKVCRHAKGFTKITVEVLSILIRYKNFTDQIFDAIDAFDVFQVLKFMMFIYS